MLSLSHVELSRRLAASQLGSLVKHIWATAEELRSQKATTGAALLQKFASEGDTFQMAFGPLSTFFGGLEVLIGPPTMINGSLKKAIALGALRAGGQRVALRDLERHGGRHV